MEALNSLLFFLSLGFIETHTPLYCLVNLIDERLHANISLELAPVLLQQFLFNLCCLAERLDVRRYSFDLAILW